MGIIGTVLVALDLGPATDHLTSTKCFEKHKFQTLWPKILILVNYYSLRFSCRFRFGVVSLRCHSRHQ